MATYKDEIFWDDLTPEAKERLFPFNNGNSCSIDELNMEIDLNDDNLLFTYDDTNVYFDDDVTERYLVESDGEIEGFYDTKFKAIAEVTMKTQIGDLICGAFKFFTNPDRDYTGIPKQPDGSAFIGSPVKERQNIWDKVTTENPESMRIILLDQEFELTANWSESRKSCHYAGRIPVSMLNRFGITECKDIDKYLPSINISQDNVTIDNGKHGYTHICPSFITII